jgi:Aspartyl protease
LAEPKTHWLYPYREDPQQTRLGQPVFRPFVPVSLAASDASTPELEGLVDTGADAILASDLLADELGLDLTENEDEELHAVGGRTITARYKTVTLRLHHHDDSGAQREWEAPVGFGAHQTGNRRDREGGTLAAPLRCPG